MLLRSTAPTYSVKAHDDTLAAWEDAQYQGGKLHLDLSSCGFFDPYGMAGLVLFLNHLPPEALPARLQLRDWDSSTATPQSAHEAGRRGAFSYLWRMNFWDLVRPVLDAPPGALPEISNTVVDRNALLDLSILHSHAAISSALRQAGDILQNLHYTVPARGHVLEVLSELCSNVLLHAQTEFGGVAAMQTYRNKNGVRYIVMGIGDAGIGVRASLAANGKLAGRLENDAQALGVAVQAGSSRFASGGHGGGLPRVLEIARRYGGRVAFRSGRGALTFNGSSQERQAFDAPPLLGTQLRISLPESKLRAEK